MKKIVISLLAVSTMAVAAAPAMAAPWQSVNQRQANIEWRIEQSQRAHRISPREARNLKAQLRDIARLEIRYRDSRPGLTQWERRDLDQRLNTLSQRIRYERNDGNNHRR